MKKALLSVAVVAVLAGAAACTNSTGGKLAPQLTFANYQPVTLNVQSTSFVDDFTVKNDPQDVSGQFVLPPGEAIKRYAANRYQASGTGSGQFTIAIEDSRVHVRQIAQNNKVLSWSGVGQEDEYTLFLRLRVTPTPDGVLRSPSTFIRMERTLVMPSSVTLEEREMRQTKFLEKLVADVDVAINKALDETPGIFR